MFESIVYSSSLITYSIGLIFGLIYTTWFCEVDSWKDQKFLPIGLFMFGSFVLILSFIAIVNLMNSPISYLGSLSTNAMAAITMSALCLVTSLFLFEIIKLDKVRFNQSRANTNAFNRIWQNLRIVFNFPFVWLLTNSVLLSQYILARPISTYTCMIGILTIISWNLSQRVSTKEIRNN